MPKWTRSSPKMSQWGQQLVHVCQAHPAPPSCLLCLQTCPAGTAKLRRGGSSGIWGQGQLREPGLLPVPGPNGRWPVGPTIFCWSNKEQTWSHFWQSLLGMVGEPWTMQNHMLFFLGRYLERWSRPVVCSASRGISSSCCILLCFILLKLFFT